MDHKELIERLRYERDDGSRDEAANAIETLLVENERLNHNLTTTEQIEHETAEACAKVYLNTYDLTDIADDIRSGKWREYL